MTSQFDFTNNEWNDIAVLPVLVGFAVAKAEDSGRIGSFRGIRAGKAGYGGTAFGEKGIAEAGGFDGYRPLVVAIADFFATGEPPVEPAETIELFAFMEAADESMKRGGAPVTIAEVLEKAKAEAVARLSTFTSP